MAISMYFYIPTIATILLVLYFIFQSYRSLVKIQEEIIKKTFTWLIVSGVAFLLWGASYLYFDFGVLSETQQLSMHYFLFPGLLFIVAIFLAMAGSSIMKFSKKYSFK